MMTQLKVESNEVKPEIGLNTQRVEQDFINQPGLKKAFRPLLWNEVGVNNLSVLDYGDNIENLQDLAYCARAESITQLFLVARDTFIKLGHLIELLRREGWGLQNLDFNNFIIVNKKLYLANVKALFLLEAERPEEQKVETLAMRPPIGFMFGNSLYRFVCDQFENHLGLCAEYSFTAPIFQSIHGTHLKSLISSLLDGTIQLNTAIFQLKKLNPMVISLKGNCLELLHSIEGIIGKRPGIKEFIECYHSKIDECENIAQIKAICVELQAVEARELTEQLLKLDCHNLLDRVIEGQKRLNDLIKFQPGVQESQSKTKTYLSPDAFIEEDHEMIDNASTIILSRFLEQLKHHEKVMLSTAQSLKSSETVSTKAQRPVHRYRVFKCPTHQSGTKVAESVVNIHPPKETDDKQELYEQFLRLKVNRQEVDKKPSKRIRTEEDETITSLQNLKF
ncbi:MAG: hypothetical protein H0U75_13265 [Legionella sp.]|nr:hypothetical protein [Legionella sp.]